MHKTHSVTSYLYLGCTECSLRIHFSSKQWDELNVYVHSAEQCTTPNMNVRQQFITRKTVEQAEMVKDG